MHMSGFSESSDIAYVSVVPGILLFCVTGTGDLFSGTVQLLPQCVSLKCTVIIGDLYSYKNESITWYCLFWGCLNSISIFSSVFYIPIRSVNLGRTYIVNVRQPSLSQIKTIDHKETSNALLDLAKTLPTSLANMTTMAKGRFKELNLNFLLLD